jgi:plasmid stability protein
MATLLIRKLDERTKARLRTRASKNGHSMAQEARELLARELARAEPEEEHLVDQIRRSLKRSGGGDIPVVPRHPMREPVVLKR